MPVHAIGRSILIPASAAGLAADYRRAGPLYLLTARTKFGVGGGGLPSGCHVTEALSLSPPADACL